METKLKPRRRYDARLRLARASDTRRRILTAAKALFNEHGIDDVTVDALSAAAGVSSPTVYGLFGSKAGILKALIDGAFFGDGYKLVMERTRSTSDPIELLRNTASISRTIFDTEREQIGLMRGASAFSPDLKRVETEFEKLRFRLQKARAELLVKTFPSARALGLARVRDIMWMYTGRDMYRMLVLERGWSSDDYEAWLADALIRSLTGQPVPPSSRVQRSAPKRDTIRGRNR